MLTTNHINLNRFLFAAGALISLCRRWLPDPTPEGTGGTGGLDPDKGKAAGTQGSPWHRLRQPPYRQWLPHAVLR
jgi:hypothetical protein